MRALDIGAVHARAELGGQVAQHLPHLLQRLQTHAPVQIHTNGFSLLREWTYLILRVKKTNQESYYYARCKRAITQTGRVFTREHT